MQVRITWKNSLTMWCKKERRNNKKRKCHNKSVKESKQLKSYWSKNNYKRQTCWEDSLNRQNWNKMVFGRNSKKTKDSYNSTHQSWWRQEISNISTIYLRSTTKSWELSSSNTHAACTPLRATITSKTTNKDSKPWLLFSWFNFWRTLSFCSWPIKTR